MRLLNNFKDSANRIEHILEQSKCSSLTALAKELKITPTEILTEIRNCNDRISVSLAGKIKKIFPELNYDWILSGAGEPYHDTISFDDHPVEIPVFTSLSVNSIESAAPVRSIIVNSSLATKAGFAFLVTSPGFSPLATEGTYLLLSQASERAEPDKLYLVMKNNGKEALGYIIDGASDGYQPVDDLGLSDNFIAKDDIAAKYTVVTIIKTAL